MNETKPAPTPTPAPPRTSTGAMQYPLGTVGAVIGAALGIFVMKLGADSGFYVEVAIGILAGLGAGWLAPRGGWTVGAIAGVVTLVAGIWAEWKFFPFVADDSLRYFLQHIFALPPFRLLIHAIGIAVAVWLGARR